uniref:Putative histone-binding protein n1/n2 n=1 Tax=Culex tarsalis TaxID=7177 RepID=A0A1Q3EWA1_CULTA
MAEKSETLVTKEDKMAEAKELFGRGSRNFCMKQYSEAADDLSACCAIYSELYGPTADECGLPYLMYAKSLTALGKDENNLIVPGEDEGEEEDEEGEEEGGEEGGEEDGEAEGKEKEGEEKMETSEGKSDENGEAKKEEPEAVSSSSKPVDEPQPGPSTSTNGGEQAEGTEEDEEEKGGGNLEVAWEILELAVKIFEAQGDKGYDNLSECYSELAGISFENTHFSEAINDYKKSLTVYEKTGKSDSRLVAEIFYKIGLCHVMLNEFDDSVKSFREACTELDKVIEQEKAKEQDDETKATIKDLEETKQEIADKIADVEEAKKTSIEEVKRELSKLMNGGGSANGFDAGAGPSSSGAGPAATNGSSASSSKSGADKPTDISHLIKRKKPDTTTAEVEGSPAKKTAVEADKGSE